MHIFYYHGLNFIDILLYYLYRQESCEDKATIAKIHAMMCETVGESELGARRLWRDQRLAALAKLKRNMK